MSGKGVWGEYELYWMWWQLRLHRWEVRIGLGKRARSVPVDPFTTQATRNLDFPLWADNTSLAPFIEPTLVRRLHQQQMGRQDLRFTTSRLRAVDPVFTGRSIPWG
jgi:hypothetical protein